MLADPHPVIPWLTPARRAYMYRLAVTAVPLLSLTGLLTDEAALHVVAVAAAILGTGTAAMYTPRRPAS